MLHIRRRIQPWMERGALAIGRFTLKDASRWQEARQLIFVCTGNICRSPYAELVARKYGMNAKSCGIATTPNLPADKTAILEAGRRGCNMAPHRTTRWLDTPLVKGDLVVALELRHALAALPRAESEEVPVVLLSSMLPDKFETLRDPYGRSRSEYSHVFDLIDICLARIADLAISNRQPPR